MKRRGGKGEVAKISVYVYIYIYINIEKNRKTSYSMSPLGRVGQPLWFTS